MNLNAIELTAAQRRVLRVLYVHAATGNPWAYANSSRAEAALVQHGLVRLGADGTCCITDDGRWLARKLFGTVDRHGTVTAEPKAVRGVR